MKLKIYLRGLGIGIVVTALIMGIATKDGRPLTDAEIKAAAAKLGMVESDQLKLTDLPQNGQETAPPQNPASPSPDPASSPKPAASQEPGESASEESGESGGNDASEQGEQEPDEPELEEPEPGEPGPGTEDTPEPVASGAGETVEITIRSGAGSRSVSNQLAEAGLIADAAAFDRYLCDNDYARRVCTGTFDIPMGTSEEQIARIITRSR